MSTTIERELSVLVEHAGYAVRFDRAGLGFDWFYTNVLYDGHLIAQKACCKSYPRAARWAKRQVRKHRKGLTALGPLALPPNREKAQSAC